MQRPNMRRFVFLAGIETVITVSAVTAHLIDATDATYSAGVGLWSSCSRLGYHLRA